MKPLTAGSREVFSAGLGSPALSRNDVVDNGEHTPLACGWGRRAANFSTTDVLDQTVGRLVRTKPAARRRRQHAGRMRSPFSSASFRLRVSSEFMLPLAGQTGTPKRELPQSRLATVDPSLRTVRPFFISIAGFVLVS